MNIKSLLEQIHLNPFFVYRLSLALSSLYALFLFSLSSNLSDIKSAGIYTFYGMLFTFGLNNHLKRSSIFLRQYRNSIFLFFIFLLAFFLLSETFNKYLSQHNLNNVLIELSVTYIISLLIFDTSVSIKSANRLIYTDLVLLYISISLIYLASQFNIFEVFSWMVVFLRVILFIFFIFNSLEEKYIVKIGRKEIAFSFFSVLSSVLPLLLITTFYIGQSSDLRQSQYEVYILRLTSIFSIFLISYFNFKKSTKTIDSIEYLRRVAFSSFFIFSIIYLFIISTAYYLKTEYILISLLPLMSLSAVYQKQHIQFEYGNFILFIFNTIFLFVTGTLVFYNSTSFTIFTCYFIFYSIIFNLLFLNKVSFRQ